MGSREFVNFVDHPITHTQRSEILESKLSNAKQVVKLEHQEQ